MWSLDVGLRISSAVGGRETEGTGDVVVIGAAVTVPRLGE